MFHLQLALLAGARTVIVGDPSAPRRAVASTLGAHIIESGRIKVEAMVTDRFPLRSTHAALDKAASGEGIKIAVMP